MTGVGKLGGIEGYAQHQFEEPNPDFDSGVRN
jgi:hypothetical protein